MLRRVRSVMEFFLFMPCSSSYQCPRGTEPFPTTGGRRHQDPLPCFKTGDELAAGQTGVVSLCRTFEIASVTARWCIGELSIRHIVSVVTDNSMAIRTSAPFA